MSWKVEVKPTAEKYYVKLDKKMRKRVRESLLELEKSENPLSHPNVRPLTGKLEGDYRLRIGDLRILFTPDKDAKMIYVFAILPRGDAY
jgi:mRNA interferase RelE/StbE